MSSSKTSGVSNLKLTFVLLRSRLLIIFLIFFILRKITSYHSLYMETNYILIYIACIYIQVFMQTTKSNLFLNYKSYIFYFVCSLVNFFKYSNWQIAFGIYLCFSPSFYISNFIYETILKILYIKFQSLVRYIQLSINFIQDLINRNVISKLTNLFLLEFLNILILKINYTLVSELELIKLFSLIILELNPNTIQ